MRVGYISKQLHRTVRNVQLAAIVILNEVEEKLRRIGLSRAEESPEGQGGL